MHIDIFEGHEEYNEICQMYWHMDNSGDFVHKVSDIANKYGLKQNSVLAKVKQSCIAYSDNCSCISCGIPYSYNSRSDYLNTKKLHDWTCLSCIENMRNSAIEKKISLLEDSFAINRSNPVQVDSLTFRHAVFLLSLVRFCGSEDLSYIKETSSNMTAFLSPQPEFDMSIIRELYQSNIIAISPCSNLNAIELTGDDNYTFYLDRVQWLIPISDDTSPGLFLNALERKLTSMDYLESSYTEMVDLCMELCFQECLSYLNLVVSEHQLTFQAGEKTRLVLMAALESFSVAQIYNFIWRAGKDAAAFYLRSNVSKSHAANTIVGNIQQQCERALANNWDIKAFRRNYDKPQSVVCQVLFNLCLHTDDGGFSQLLSKIL